MKNTGAERGFTITELLIAIAFFTVMSASAVTVYSAAVPSIRANGQVNRVLGMLQNARETAIARQRNMRIVPDAANNQIDLFRVEGDDEIFVERVAFEYNVTFNLFDVAPDTPEQYGNDEAVDFGGEEDLFFNSEGSLVDEDGVPINGTLFMGIGEDSTTARAIAITGSTGRARFYTWTLREEWEGGWFGK